MTDGERRSGRRRGVSRTARWSVGAVACAAMAVAGPALGAPKPAAAVTAGFGVRNLALDTDAYYPNRVTVVVGQRVRFTFSGFHTVTFPPRSGKLPQLIVQTAGKNPAMNDPAGVPYWWGAATPVLAFNPAAPAPTRTTAVTGTRLVSSGFPMGPRSALVATFPRAGTFRYFCLVHPLMRGEVRVLPRTAKPSHAGDAARARTERAADAAAARSAVAKANTPAPGNTSVLVGVGTRRWSVLAFLPKTITVKAGVPVTFRSAGRNEVHTVTFGPKDYLDVLEKQFEAAQASFPPETAYPSDPPGAAPVAVTPASHGNGFVNSGLMGDALPGAPQPAFSVVFPTPGTYAYRCLVHGAFMSGTVTVIP